LFVGTTVPVFHPIKTKWAVTQHARVIRNAYKILVGKPIIIMIIIINILIDLTTFMNKKIKNNFLIDIAVPNKHNLAKTINEKQNKYQELANEICAMWKQKAAQVIPLVISSTGVIPKSLSQSLSRLNLHPNTYIQVKKICNSCHRFSCKKLLKLQIRPSSLILLITTSQDR